MMMGFGPVSPGFGAMPSLASTLVPSLSSVPSLSQSQFVPLAAPLPPIQVPGPKDWSPRGRHGMILVRG